MPLCGRKNEYECGRKQINERDVDNATIQFH